MAEDKRVWRKLIGLAVLWLVGSTLCDRGVLGDEPMARQWQDTTGSFQITARFVRLDGLTVVLAKTDASGDALGGESDYLRVPLNRLSDNDRAYISDQVLATTAEVMSISLPFIEAQERLILPLPAVSSDWDYEIKALQVRERNNVVDLGPQHAGTNSPTGRPQAQTARLKKTGYFAIPMTAGGVNYEIRVAMELRKFKDMIVLLLTPTVELKKGINIDFSAKAIAESIPKLEQAIIDKRQRYREYESDLRSLPGQLSQAESAAARAGSDPAARAITTQAINKIRGEIKRAQQNAVSIERSLPEDEAKLAALKLLGGTVNQLAGQVVLDFEVTQHVGAVSRVVLRSNPHSGTPLVAYTANSINPTTAGTPVASRASAPGSSDLLDSSANSAAQSNQDSAADLFGSSAPPPASDTSTPSSPTAFPDTSAPSTPASSAGTTPGELLWTDRTLWVSGQGSDWLSFATVDPRSPNFGSGLTSIPEGLMVRGIPGDLAAQLQVGQEVKVTARVREQSRDALSGMRVFAVENNEITITVPEQAPAAPANVTPTSASGAPPTSSFPPGPAPASPSGAGPTAEGDPSSAATQVAASPADGSTMTNIVVSGLAVVGAVAVSAWLITSNLRR